MGQGDSTSTPKQPGPEPERFKVEGDPLQAFKKLLQPTPKAAKKPRKRAK